MDKVFSTRIDEDVIRQVDAYVKRRGISKKRLVEAALRAYFKERGAKHAHEIPERAFGAWSRTETVQDTCARARSAFNRSFHHHEVTREDDL
jgi:metal-responsive CopG/Arc/MetJ family transcriptional regulator